MGGPKHPKVGSQNSSRAHSPRPNRNINIILTTTYVESTPATLIFRSSHSFITLTSSALYFFSLVHYIISHTSITLSITSGMFFFVFKFYLYVLNMILETPNFKVTNIIFKSYEHRSEIVLQLLTSFVFLKVGFVPHKRTYS